MSPRLPKDNIYTALRTIDITDHQQNISQSIIRSTPAKGQSSQSIIQESSTPSRSIIGNRK